MPEEPNTVFGRTFDTILLDLDDALYQNHEIAATVRLNIQEFMAEQLQIPADQVEQLTQELYFQHGTTMAGLAAKGYQLDFDAWHAFIHGRLDYDRLLHLQPETRQVLANLNLSKHLLTNADAKHAAACLTRMGVADCFETIWCFENVMELAGSKGLLTKETPVMCKPNKQTFELVLQQLGATPAHTIFVDDSLRNIAAAHELGIFTVLVSPKLAAQQPHHVPGADLVVSCFEQLPQVLPQVFVSEEPRLAEDVVPAGVPVRVMAA